MAWTDKLNLFGKAKAQSTPLWTPAPQWSQMGYSSEDQYNADQGITAGDVEGRQIQTDWANKNWGNDVTDTNYGYNGKGGKFAPVYAGGNKYTNYNDLANYGVEQWNKKFANSQKEIENAYANGLLDYGQRQEMLNQERQNVQNQIKAMKTNYNRQYEGINKEYDNTLQSQSMYFSNVSPNAFQSQQDVYGGEAAKTRDLGISDLKEQKRLNDIKIKRAQQELLSNSNALSRYKNDLSSRKQAALAQAEQDAIEGVDTIKNQALDYGLDLPNLKATGMNLKNYDLSPYYNKLMSADSAIGQRIVGGQIKPQQAYMSYKQSIMDDMGLTDEEKQRELDMLDQQFGISQYMNQ